MRIVVWNCKMGLARKRQHLYDLCPDIAAIIVTALSASSGSSQD